MTQWLEFELKMMKQGITEQQLLDLRRNPKAQAQIAEFFEEARRIAQQALEQVKNEEE